MQPAFIALKNSEEGGDMMKAIEFWVEYNFIDYEDREKPMDIKTGFKTREDAERWSHRYTLDGKVTGIYKKGDF